MVKFVALSMAILLGGLAFGQIDPVQLGDAVPVDVHVTEVNWHNDGNALIYGRQEQSGIGIGVYGVGSYEGKTLIHLAKGETYQTYWLSGSKSALIVTRGPAPQAVKSNQIRMFVMDADTLTVKPIFSEIFEEKSTPKVVVDQSPLLKHAIITLRSSLEPRHFVIVSGTGELIKAPDLDRAEKQGLTGPSWSVDGTAIYSDIPYKSYFTSGVEFQVVGKSGDKIQAGDSFEVSVSNLKLDSSQPVAKTISLSFRAMPPTPPTGSSVMELMPTNAVLRPVRFRGPFQPVYVNRVPLLPQVKSIVLQYEKSNAQDNSVWIRRGTEKGAPATLLAVHASETWLSPNQSAIAYVIDGALFVRTIR